MGLERPIKAVTIYSTYGGQWLVMLSDATRGGVQQIIGKYDKKSEAIRMAKRATDKTYGPATQYEDRSGNA